MTALTTASAPEVGRARLGAARDGVGDVRTVRLRWAVRATLLFGVAASISANVLHAEPNPISQAIAAWPPLALLLTVELIGKVPVRGKALAVVRLIATSAIAGIAAWVSYWHMSGVAARYGETGASALLLPLSVDGLIVVASISLVELSARADGSPAIVAAVGPAVRPDAAPARKPTPAGANPGAGRVAPPTAAAGDVPASPSAVQTGSRSRRDGVLATAQQVAECRTDDPSLSPAAVARRIGRSERTVRRHWQSAAVSASG